MALSKNYQCFIKEDDKNWDFNKNYILATNVSLSLNQSSSPRRVFRRSSSPLVSANSAAQSLSLSISCYIEVDEFDNILGGIRHIINNLPIVTDYNDIKIESLQKKYEIRIGIQAFSGYLNTYQINVEAGKPVMITIDFLCDAPNYDMSKPIGQETIFNVFDSDLFKYRICSAEDIILNVPNTDLKISFTAKYSINRTPVFNIGDYNISSTLIDSCQALFDIVTHDGIALDGINTGFSSFILVGIRKDKTNNVGNAIFRMNPFYIESKQITLAQDNILAVQTSYGAFLV